MNILVWGGDSWANRGDDAVLAGTLVALRAKVPRARIVVASDKPTETAVRHGAKAVRRASLRLLWALICADVVVWGGGLLIQNQSSRAFLLVQLLFVALAVLLGKRVVCYGQGVGPVRGRLFRLGLRVVLPRLAAVTVRDRASARRFRALGIEARVFTDPSFCVQACPVPAGPLPNGRGSDAGGPPFIAVALRRWGHYRGGWRPVRWTRARTSPEFETFCREVALALDQLPARVLFVPMCPGGDQGDDEVAEKVRRLMRRETTVLEDPLPAAQLKGLLGQAEMVIAMRTHAGILAAGAGTPVLSVSYQGKGRAFMSELGLSQYCLPWQHVTSERLAAMAQRLWGQRDVVRGQLRRRVPEMRSGAIRNAEVVAKLPWSALYAGHGRLARLVRERRRVALELLAPQPGERVLDLGCGVGAYRDGVNARGSEWIGLDMIHGPLRGDVRTLPIADGALCGALAVGVLDYLELDPAMAEIGRVLRCGGRAVVSYNGRWWGGAVRDRMPWTGVRSSALHDHTKAIVPALAGAGLTIEREACIRGGALSPDTTLLLVLKP